MASSRVTPVSWWLLAAAMVMTGGSGVAMAEPPVFDEVGYTTCTALAPVPVADPDGVATTCCAEHGGIPTGTNYGIGCVKQVVDAAPDYRPVIVMPTWPSGPEGELALDELAKLPPLP